MTSYTVSHTSKASRIYKKKISLIFVEKSMSEKNVFHHAFCIKGRDKGFWLEVLLPMMMLMVRRRRRMWAKNYKGLGNSSLQLYYNWKTIDQSFEFSLENLANENRIYFKHEYFLKTKHNKFRPVLLNWTVGTKRKLRNFFPKGSHKKKTTKFWSAAQPNLLSKKGMNMF